MGALRYFALLIVGALTGCSSGPTRPQTPDDGLRVEVLAWTSIPPTHDTFGTIGGLSGALFREVNDYDEFDGVWRPLETDPQHAAPVEFVTDDPMSSKVYQGLVSLSFENDAPQLRVTLTHEHALEHDGVRDAEAVARLRTHPDVTKRPGELHITTYEAPPSVVLTTYTPSERRPLSTRTLVLPESIARARTNRAFESGAITPDGTLWIATEAALEQDGPEATSAGGTRCLVLTGKASTLKESYFYETEPMPRHIGPTFAIQSLVDLEALPDGSLLALERSLTLPAGYNARLFHCDTTSSQHDTARLPILNKRPLADLGTLAREAGVPWIGNLEAIALGPPISALSNDPTQEGRLLLLVADDNFGADIQRTGSRVLALRLLGLDEPSP